MAAVAEQVRAAMATLNVTEEQFLQMTLECSGEDEMAVILNFLGWLDKHGYCILTEAEDMAR